MPKLTATLKHRRGYAMLLVGKVRGNHDLQRFSNLIGLHRGLQAAQVLYGICTRPFPTTSPFRILDTRLVQVSIL